MLLGKQRGMPIPTPVRTVAKPEDVLRAVGIRAGMKVVDLGCGPGYFLVPAARFVGRTGRAVGVDILTAAVDEAKKRARLAGTSEWTDVFRSDLTRPASASVPDDWADLVLLSGILAQSDPMAVLREAARVVKPRDGRVAAIEWDSVATPIGPPPEHRVDQATVLAAAKAAGLAFLSTFVPSTSQYGLLFLKASAAA